jgi:hypothetical protein
LRVLALLQRSVEHEQSSNKNKHRDTGHKALPLLSPLTVWHDGPCIFNVTAGRS